jgi:hypothetical protein
MKVLSKSFNINKETFQPECIITLAIPMQLVEDTNNIVKEDGFVKFYEEFGNAIQEYDNLNVVIPENVK